MEVYIANNKKKELGISQNIFPNVDDSERLLIVFIMGNWVTIYCYVWVELKPEMGFLSNVFICC